MSLENRFVALPEANTSRLRTAVRLPYGLEKEVGLNVRAIEQLAQIGGISMIKFSLGQVEQDSAQIIGITSSGQALGGFSRTISQPYDLENVTPNMAPSPDRWSTLEITLDSEAARRWIESQGKSIDNPQSWADLINQGLKAGILSSGVGNLMEREVVNWTFSLMGTAFLVQDLLNKDYLNFTIKYGTWKSSYELLSLYREGIEKEGGGRRLSLMIFNGPEVDRMAMLLLGLATNRLAQSLKQS